MRCQNHSLGYCHGILKDLQSQDPPYFPCFSNDFDIYLFVGDSTNIHILINIELMSPHRE